MQTVKVIQAGRPTNAEEWAMRQGSAIAEKHLPSADFLTQSALASDIAEALTSVRHLCRAGAM